MVIGSGDGRIATGAESGRWEREAVVLIVVSSLAGLGPGPPHSPTQLTTSSRR